MEEDCKDPKIISLGWSYRGPICVGQSGKWFVSLERMEV